uniref:Uncharacterized protein n=1 Tax=Siphoviridae sp. ctSMg55 TaxID=2825509 RepID=A0A8S5V4V0_9CAUD|nr:MAG TPA: hypothetical protein [Siphoviridae sp. ctSMg55]
MLDKKACKLLDLFYKKDRLTFDEIQSETHEEERASSSLCVSALCSEKFISTWESSESINDVGDHKQFGYEITYAGRAYVDQRRRDGRNFWVPYLITTLIAISSLIVSIVKP